ncbi:MAG: 50S ribosomal protein L3 [bacterium]|nr:50S ribosomal protein L3 [bacterium]
MSTAVFATKLGMTQAWTTSGKRVAVTRCKFDLSKIMAVEPVANGTDTPTAFKLNVATGSKKLKNMDKPLRVQLTKGGFSSGATAFTQVEIDAQDQAFAVGDVLAPSTLLEVGDVVHVQGTTKGRGFAGAMKRHNFSGGPATHGQSDRARAVGSIGQRSTPGRVWKGKRMPGHYGDETQTVKGIVVIHIDAANQEVWLSGPVPGFTTSMVRISKTGDKKDITLDLKASGVAESPAPVEAPAEVPVEVEA